MNELFNRIARAARNCGVKQDERFWLFVAQVFAWAKISGGDSLNDDLNIQKFFKVSDQRGLLRDAFTVLFVQSRLRGEMSIFKLDDEFLNDMPFELLSSIVEKVQKVVSEKNFKYEQILPEIWNNLHRSVRGSEPPSDDLVRMLFSLASMATNSTVYCPYDQFLSLSLAATSQSKEVNAEGFGTGMRPEWASLATTLGSDNIHVADTDPVINPSWVEDGKLQQFDYSFAILQPFPRYDQDVIDDDQYERFDRRGSSAETFQLIHILKQTRKKAILLVPPNFLTRTVGLEAEVKSQFIEIDQCLESIISLPPGCYPGSKIPCNILIFDMEREPVREGLKHKVFCVDGNAITERHGSAENVPFNVTALSELYSNKLIIAEESAMVSTTEIREQDFNLQVERYILSGEARHLQDFLKTHETADLSELVKIVRTQPVRSRSVFEDNNETFHEIAFADFPDAGYLNTASKEINVAAGMLKKAHKQVVKPMDVLLSVKGAIGRVAIVGNDIPENAIAGQMMVILRCTNIDPRVLYMYLKSPVCQEYLLSRITGAAVSILQASDLNSLPVVPLRPQQEVVIASFQEEVAIQGQIRKLTEEMQQIRSRHWTLNRE